MPFLRHVTQGRGVPDERLAEVAEHYAHFGGKSPLPAQVRAMRDAIAHEFEAHGVDLPVEIAFRHSHPFVDETLARLTERGATRVLAFVTSAQSSYSGCRQYLEDIERARAVLGEEAPVVDKLRAFFDHPRYVEAVVGHVNDARATLGPERRQASHLLFTAHSIPIAMARGADYEAQLRAAMGIVSEAVGAASASLAFQSRSGPPQVPWARAGRGRRARGSRERRCSRRRCRADRFRDGPHGGALRSRRRAARARGKRSVCASSVPPRRERMRASSRWCASSSLNERARRPSVPCRPSR